ncbi:MAG: exodeoxyribonuclease-3 [Chitinophagales bacterium]|jgi:exodeoxyribonuclease-3
MELTMRIITANTNGIRAAARKGFFDWLPKQDADVVCIQETKAQIDQLSDPIFHPTAYSYYFDAEKKGYSGTALYCKHEPDNVAYGMGWDGCDKEGRYLRADYKNTSVVSIYMPSGTSGEPRLQFKYEMMAVMFEHFRELKASGREIVLCADWNICHKEIDLKNWKGNKKNSGFLPEERAWIERLLTEEKWTDSFRVVNPNEDQFTWWSNRGQARANNVGWRLDYHLVTQGLADKVLCDQIYKNESFSDHAPLIIDYNWEI